MFRTSRMRLVAITSAILSSLLLSSAYPHSGYSYLVTTYVHSHTWAESFLLWFNRQTCRWLSNCEPTASSSHNLVHYVDQQPILSGSQPLLDPSKFWTSGLERPEEWSNEQNRSRTIPQYVYDYTPYVHLFSGEQFWPCDMAEHLVHTSPYANYTLIRSMENDRTLDNLDGLNKYAPYVYLQSEDNVEERPDWLVGNQNIPSSPEDTSRISAKGPDGLQSLGGYSSAPAVLIVVPKEDGIVDAFWFYFYSFNLGNSVLNVRFGNHVGDWEHSMVRFRNGTPEAVYLSEHGAGEAYAYHAVEKIGKRPVVYSATGTHAMYATSGMHPYVLPWGLLHDQTDGGPLWDPNLNHHAYVYNHTSRHLESSTQTPYAPVSWFNFQSHWGDKIYPRSDSRQYSVWGQYHYVSGPLGPRFKNLGRNRVCQRRDIECVIKHWLGEGGSDLAKSLPGTEMGEDMVEAGSLE